MITIKLLALWYVLSSLIYAWVSLFTGEEDFSRRGANVVFLLSQGLSGLILWSLS